MNVRKLAAEAIEKILYKGGFSNIVINEYLKKYELTEENKALFTKLVLGTIENKITLEFYLAPYLQKRQKTWIHILLLMSLYQLVFLDIPKYAIVNEAVDIAHLKDHKIASFINAVLRNFLRNDLRQIEVLEPLERLSIKYSYPIWLVAYLLKDYTYEIVEKIFKTNSLVKRDAIRINTLKTNINDVKEQFDKENIEYEENSLINNGLIVSKPLITHPLFTSGKITIQDISSQKVSEIVNPKENSRVLDICSAPGGKTSHMASIMNNTGEIYACDIHPHKIKLMENNFKKLGVTNVKTKLCDARELLNAFGEESFDYVLADMPCSGLGVLGHKVDIKYHITLDAINEIITLQRDILNKTYMLVKHGGFLIISTCTINKKENEEQILEFIKNHQEFEKIEEMTILPFEYNSDGFYICKLRRN